ncbi:protein singed wings 2 [Condylostylus longicornis]|uniref:protein singed wings 2 n=1 Tax=Condylostylus longicornis TaxID=2530218 RepID=UPI00244DC780|nr:protein singed wings 2 [Condylostylus longicornis]
MVKNYYQIIIIGVTLFSIFFTSYSVAEFDIHIPVDHGTCENWTTMPEADVGNCTKNGRVLHCFGGMANVHVMNPSKVKKIEELILCGWPNETFDPQLILPQFPKIRYLKIEHGQLTYIPKAFPELHHLKSINISWTNLSNIQQNLFKKLHNLKELDLRWNHLDFIEYPLTIPETFQHLYLDGNPWNCTKNLEWILNPINKDRIVDRELLFCADKLYRSRHLMTVLHYQVVLRTMCNSVELKNCTCTMHYITKSENERLTPIYAVNCSNLNLTRFPSFVPQNTTIFYANNNKISDLRPLRNNPNYRTVVDIYLDNNRVPNIDVLEAGYWLRHFRVFSLRGNRLTKLPIYALDNALEFNSNAVSLYLSRNAWRCDCKFAMRFHELLLKYLEIIVDSANITCKYFDGDRSYTLNVLNIERSTVCKLPNENSKIQPIDLVNCTLAFLILFVFTKLGYDYYHYRKSGRLPWIVTKIL